MLTEYFCPYCRDCFISPDGVKRHVQNKHPEFKDDFFGVHYKRIMTIKK